MACNNHGWPAKLVPGDIDDEAIPFQPRMSAAPSAVRVVEIPEDVFGRDVEATVEMVRQQVGTVTTRAAWEIFFADAPPESPVDCLQRPPEGRGRYQDIVIGRMAHKPRLPAKYLGDPIRKLPQRSRSRPERL